MWNRSKDNGKKQKKLSEDISFKTITSNDIYRVLFVESRDGIVLIDGETGNIIDANPEFERQSGRSLEVLTKLKIWQLRPLEKRIQAKEKFKQIKKDGIGQSRELDYLKPDGQITPIDFQSKLIIINDREFIISTSRDISLSKSIENQLLLQKEQLLNQRNELESFASIIAHDIRGKLQIISLYNELVTDSIYKEKIDDQINEIKIFLENLLLLAQEGEILGNLETVDLNELISQLFIKITHINPSIKLISSNLVEITGDKTKINQIFENLLLNVVKHANATEIHVSAIVDSNYFVVTIEDNGKGMTPEQIESITSDTQIDKYKSLGLTIVRKIIEAHKGSFEIISELNKGTKVLIKIPK
ncbi:MAG: ATP-binding protein [Candidatus Thorarchaeota archaeon]